MPSCGVQKKRYLPGTVKIWRKPSPGCSSGDAKGFAPAGKAAPREEPKSHKLDPKVAGLQKRLAAAKKKLEDARAAGTPTRVLEDKIYEIEDELRLAGQGQ